ncbi:MAG: tetratricopeptide repeat protein, partial [Methylococcales bacterium]
GDPAGCSGPASKKPIRHDRIDKIAIPAREPASAVQVDQGHAFAQTNLGRIYETGKGVSKDFGKALGWYHRAAAQGHASAQVNLGRTVETGKGVSQSFENALGWYRKAAAHKGCLGTI